MPSPSALRRKAAQAEKRPYRYERTCRDREVPAGMPFVLRARLPVDGAVSFDDRVLGTITTSNTLPRLGVELDVCFDGIKGSQAVGSL